MRTNDLPLYQCCWDYPMKVIQLVLTTTVILVNLSIIWKKWFNYSIMDYLVIDFSPTVVSFLCQETCIMTITILYLKYDKIAATSSWHCLCNKTYWLTLLWPPKQHCSYFITICWDPRAIEFKRVILQLFLSRARIWPAERQESLSPSVISQVPPAKQHRNDPDRLTSAHSHTRRLTCHLAEITCASSNCCVEWCADSRWRKKKSV